MTYEEKMIGLTKILHKHAAEIGRYLAENDLCCEVRGANVGKYNEGSSIHQEAPSIQLYFDDDCEVGEQMKELGDVRERLLPSQGYFAFTEYATVLNGSNVFSVEMSRRVD